MAPKVITQYYYYYSCSSCLWGWPSIAAQEAGCWFPGSQESFICSLNGLTSLPSPSLVENPVHLFSVKWSLLPVALTALLPICGCPLAQERPIRDEKSIVQLGNMLYSLLWPGKLFFVTHLLFSSFRLQGSKVTFWASVCLENSQRMSVGC